MKRIHAICIFVFLSLCASTNAQTSLLAPNKIWKNQCTIYPMGHLQQWNVYYQVGDTETINGNIYSKIIELHSDYFPIAGYVREDGKRVYKLKDNQDVLMFDFGLAFGDTIHPIPNDDTTYYKNVGEDSVQIAGVYNKRIKIETNQSSPHYFPPYNSYWIEGIGDQTTGLFGFWDANWGWNIELQCVNLNSQSIYGTQNCQINIVGGVEDISNQFSLYPNPVQNLLRLKINPNTFSEIQIFDVSGRLFFSKRMNTESVLEISTFDFPKGLLMLELASKDGSKVHRKIIKE